MGDPKGYDIRSLKKICFEVGQLHMSNFFTQSGHRNHNCQILPRKMANFEIKEVAQLQKYFHFSRMCKLSFNIYFQPQCVTKIR